MHLSNIKLSGFKSFVDHTSINILGNLVGIVGPNGCGKSNIIDAVIWVMGESSAKHLRGDALTDVIFSGSSARQPVGQAAVELLFDNMEKKLGGKYASYNEISVKRQINRDGISTYFLNGTRCRRRDITAIFLGTGLGHRSYAIIEQGMISHLIEAKPEELRVYIEEAAGISKYREHRRETENRISRTRENLERLNDIRDELEKQLNHLQKQAKVAERYRGLKQKERQLSAELLALQWCDISAEMTKLKDKSRKQENAVEAVVAHIREIEVATEKQREALSEANEDFNNKQSKYYQIGGDIAQYEQQLQYTQEKIATLETELKKTLANQKVAEEQHKQDQVENNKLLVELQSIEPRLRDSRSASNRAYETLTKAEEAMQLWQSEWDLFNDSFSEFNQREQAGKSSYGYLQSGLEDLKERRYQLQTELDKYAQSELVSKIEQLNHKLQQHESSLAKNADGYAQGQTIVKQRRESVRELGLQLDVARNDYQALKLQLASLETLQQSILDENENADLQQWLQDNQLDKLQRLSQQLKIDEKWAHALETVTNVRLGHICVENVADYLYGLDSAPGKLGLISTRANAVAEVDRSWPRLVDYLKCDFKLPFILNNIYAVDNLDVARSMLRDLPKGHSIVTVDGVWLSHDWAIVNRSMAVADTVLGREREIRTICMQLQQAEASLRNIEQQLKLAEAELEQSERQVEKYQSGLTTEQQQLADLRAELATNQAQAEQNTRRNQELIEDLNALEKQERNNNVEIETVSQRLQELGVDKQKLTEQKQNLIEIKDKHCDALHEARTEWQTAHEESHSISLQLESYNSRRASYEKAIKRNEIQLQHIAKRLAELQQELKDSRIPISELQNNLEQALVTKLQTEKNLSEARATMQEIETSLRELEQSRRQQEQELEELRTTLEKTRINANGCQVRLEAILEKLRAYGQSAEDLLQQMDENAEQAAWQKQLEALNKKIQCLGAINLAAIDEYAHGAERKTYLDSQHKDLTEALKTLENAIRKIDKETKARFRESFDKLNANIKETFPKLFGGGHAYLELTDEDLLQAGVVVIARPPGKKNSNIHLLSGGEKALIAVALVFAIFKLNPAPFCILDEVDAPLDDANVSRFCELLKSMSSAVQFIFITHNKITMETAHQLMGVTMYEAGVSRLVSVDVDEAVEMAATA